MSKKTINVNPIYLSPPSSKSRKRNHKLVTHSRSAPGEKQLRNKLLTKIKDFKAQTNKTPISTNASENLDDFDKSIQYLQDIASKNNVKRKSKKQRKKHQKITLNTPAISNKTNPPEQPPYSCLKNGSRPTYRTWKNLHNSRPKLTINTGEMPTPTETIRGKTLQKIKNDIKTKTATFADMPLSISKPTLDKPLVQQGAASSLSALPPPLPPPPLSPPPISLQPMSLSPSPTTALSSSAEPAPTPPKPKKPSSHMKKTKKFVLGKNGKQVHVLIKNRWTRKKIKEEHNRLKQTSIAEVKKYLKERQLLKAGSCAPNDVLRATYEQAILAGEVSNKGDDTLVHNFLSKK